MAYVGTHWNGNSFTVHVMKFIGFVTEINDFCRIHKGEIQRIEEEHQICPLIVFKSGFFELSVDNGCTFKTGCMLGPHRSRVRETGAKRQIFLNWNQATLHLSNILSENQQARSCRGSHAPRNGASQVGQLPEQPSLLAAIFSPPSDSYIVILELASVATSWFKNTYQISLILRYTFKLV